MIQDHVRGREDRQTDRQTDRNIQTDKKTDRLNHAYPRTQGLVVEVDEVIHEHVGGRQTDTQEYTYRQTDRQKHTDRQKDRQTESCLP